jgi:hypothetical protein
LVHTARAPHQQHIHQPLVRQQQPNRSSMQQDNSARRYNWLLPTPVRAHHEQVAQRAVNPLDLTSESQPRLINSTHARHQHARVRSHYRSSSTDDGNAQRPKVRRSETFTLWRRRALPHGCHAWRSACCARTWGQPAMRVRGFHDNISDNHAATLRARSRARER